MEMTQIKQNKLKMILQFSIPSIIAMLLQTVITITDGFYTGNYVGEQALAAINLFADDGNSGGCVCNQFTFCVCALSADTWHPACRWQFVWIFYTVLQGYAFHLSTHGEQHGFGNVHSC